ncbi:hypothetical protein AB0F71_19295 [Kitasatospora sp. NPDC028055]|uniref:hypothetical protein n=1 Tax=Kitasatospora sp. NPDC028055 TaxID=3155653 RepID=UPI0034076ADA
MPEGSADHDAAPPVDTRFNWVGVLTSVVAPTTFVTALLFFLGFAYTDSFYHYFGLDAATLGFSTPDFLVRGSPALFVPVGGLLFGMLLVALGYHLATRRGGSGWVRRVCLVLAVAVVPLLALGFLAGFEAVDLGPDAAPLFIGGALLLALLTRMLFVRTTGSPYPLRGERTAVAVIVAIVVLCCFWAATGYAHTKGTEDARRLGSQLDERPAMIVDTTEPLYVTWPAVREAPLADAGQGQRFHHRYHGFRLLAQSGSRMFLIPRDWTWDTGNVLVLSLDSGVRVAFHPG